MLTSLAALAAIPVFSPAPIALIRTFMAGQKLSYAIRGELRAEDRVSGLDTWIPTNVTLAYGFSMTVKQLKADGIADVVYQRPTFTEIQGEDFDSGPKKHVDKIDEKLLITLSPINQILDVKNLNPTAGKKKKKNTDADGEGFTSPLARNQEVLDARKFVNELHRLSVFVGSFDSALDFNPKFPLDKVAIGDTWKQTVSYQPQSLGGGKKGDEEVQRLDYVYTYKGPMISDGKSIQRVEATLDLNTDLGAFFNQLMESTPAESGLEKIPMRLKATIEFDLDPKTMMTVHAVAKSEGGFSLYVHEHPDAPVTEERFRGLTTESLVGDSVPK